MFAIGGIGIREDVSIASVAHTLSSGALIIIIIIGRLKIEK